jgi:hypothetical protein
MLRVTVADRSHPRLAHQHATPSRQDHLAELVQHRGSRGKRGDSTARAVRPHQPLVAAYRAHHCGGKSWSRVHVIQEPLSEYLRYELIGYVESMAVGEEIRLAYPLKDRALVDF